MQASQWTNTKNIRNNKKRVKKLKHLQTKTCKKNLDIYLNKKDLCKI